MGLVELYLYGSVLVFILLRVVLVWVAGVLGDFVWCYVGLIMEW